MLDEPEDARRELKFRNDVWKRDRNQCRRCHRTVIRSLEHVKTRGEVHHCHGRIGALRYETRAALLLCLQCHQRVTGAVNDKLFIIASRGFRLAGSVCIDARHPVRFERAA